MCRCEDDVVEEFEYKIGKVVKEIGKLVHKIRIKTYDPAVDGTQEEILERLERMLS